MAPTAAAACRFAAKRSKMTNALSLFLDHPRWLVLTGTVLLILGLTGLALFRPTDIKSTEGRSPEGPEAADKETQCPSFFTSTRASRLGTPIIQGLRQQSCLTFY